MQREEIMCDHCAGNFISQRKREMRLKKSRITRLEDGERARELRTRRQSQFKRIQLSFSI